MKYPSVIKHIRNFVLALFCGTVFSLSAQDVARNSNHPTWSSQSNVYEVNLRQYSQSGTIRDFEKHLPRLRKMGVEILWFMPVTPIGITDRKMTPADLGSYYAVKDYKAINPEFGTMADFKAMVVNAHDQGFKVITDWVANHSSTDNHWIKAHPDFYAKDSAGKIISPFDWTDTYKLNYQNREMRDSMVDAMKFWIRETGIDGFRCDVAEEVPQDFWRDCITELKKVKHVYMLAEGDKPWLHEVGFDQTYAWTIGAAMTDLYAGKKSLAQFDSVVTQNLSAVPADAYKLFFTTNHDENSWNGTEFEKYGDAYKTFAVFTQTMHKSVPLIYNGQEVPNKKRLKFFVKDPIEWEEFAMEPFYSTLLHLRKSNTALAANADYKRLKTSADDKVYAYLRSSGARKVAVMLNMSAKPAKFTVSDAEIEGSPFNVFQKQKEKLSSARQFSLEPWGFLVYSY